MNTTPGLPLVRVLGSTRVVANGQTQQVRGLAGHILCVLGASPGRAIARQDLIERLWQDPPQSAKTALQVAIHKLRNALDPEGTDGRESKISRRNDLYFLDPDAVEVDATVFFDEVARARVLVDVGAWTEAEHHIEVGLQIWDDPFASYQDDLGLVVESQRLLEIKFKAEELLSEARLQTRGEQQIERLSDLARQQPLREIRWEHLVRGMIGEGRQAEALAAFGKARTALAEIGVIPSQRLAELEDRVHRGDPLLGVGVARGSQLLYGRDSAIEHLQRLATPGAVVTVTGAPGIGKTALVETWGKTLRGTGARFVAVQRGPSEEPTEAIVNAFVKTEVTDLSLGMGLELLADTLNRSTVVLLDGYQGKGLAAQLKAITKAGASSTFVVTRSEPIGLPDERVLELGPLTLPVPGASAEDAWKAASMQLFAAHSLPQGSRLGERTEDVMEIVRETGGHPVSIILAARRTDHLGVPEIHQGGRSSQSSVVGYDLGESVERSLSVLDVNARGVLEVVGQFEGSWTLDDLRLVTTSLGTTSDAAAGVEELSRRSLLHHQGDGVYQVLACVRDHIDFSGFQQPSSFIRAVGDLAVGLDAELRTETQIEALRRFKLTAADLERALQSSVELGDYELAWGIYGSLGHFWWLTQQRAKSLAWEARVIPMIDPSELKPSIAIRALNAAGTSGFSYLRFSEKKHHLEKAVEIAGLHPPTVDGALAHAHLAIATAFESFADQRGVDLAAKSLLWADDLGDPFALGFAHLAKAAAAISFFDFESAVRDLNLSVGVVDELGVPSMGAFARLNLGHIHLYRREFETARAAYEESIPLAGLIDERGWVATSALYGLGEAQQALDDDRARGTYKTALEDFRALGDARGAVLAALRIAQLETESGNPDDGNRYLGFAKGHRRFHDEAALRACVEITEAFLDNEAGRVEEARAHIVQATSLASGIGAPLGPIDSDLLLKVESSLAAASDGSK